MAYINSANVKFSNLADLIIEEDGAGNVTSCFNRSNNIDYIFNDIGKSAAVVFDSSPTKILLKDTLFNGWTPSTTEKIIVTKNTVATITAEAGYDYIAEISFNADIKYPAVGAAQFLRGLTTGFRVYGLQPGSYDELVSNTYTAPTLNSTNIVYQVYTDSSNNPTLYAAGGNGFFITITDIMAVATGGFTVSLPAVKVKCHSTYFSTTEAALVDQDQSFIEYSVKVYKVKQFSNFITSLYKSTAELY